MNFKSAKEFSSNSSRFLNNNNNIDVEKCCSSNVEKLSEELPKVNSEEQADSENENQEISEDEEFANYEDDDEQLSSPSNSHNSDNDQRWYAFRGQWMISNMNPQPPLLPLDNQRPPENPPQEEEETDFLEMDFEPDTNSEIENEAKGAADYAPLPNVVHLPPQIIFPEELVKPSRNVNTGAKPKQSTMRTSKHITKSFEFRSSPCNLNLSPSLNSNSPADDYNMGASCSYHDRESTEKSNKSPSKSSNRSHKQLRLEEERQNERFLFEIEPLKPTTKNSVTIYTTNCDEKVFIDALVSHEDKKI